MKSLLLVAAACFALSGCEELKSPEYAPDQKDRQRIFKECMAGLPEGPKATTYNDWDEVVGECAKAAYYQSLYCYENCPPARKPDDEINPGAVTYVGR